jgi:hypothetical protein
MGVEWYDMIARRNGGYKGRAVCTFDGRSAEDIFEERLVDLLPNFLSVMDAGCGHGEFTLAWLRQSVDTQTAVSPVRTRYSAVVDNFVWCLQISGVKAAKYPIFAGVLRFSEPKQLPDVLLSIRSAGIAFRHPNGIQSSAASA